MANWAWLTATGVQIHVGVFRNSAGTPSRARPFFDVVNNREDASLVAFPGLLRGAIEISASSHLQGAEAYLQKVLCHGEK